MLLRSKRFLIAKMNPKMRNRSLAITMKNAMRRYHYQSLWTQWERFIRKFNKMTVIEIVIQSPKGAENGLEIPALASGEIPALMQHYSVTIVGGV
jgi:hypothetical protein